MYACCEAQVTPRRPEVEHTPCALFGSTCLGLGQRVASPPQDVLLAHPIELSAIWADTHLRVGKTRAATNFAGLVSEACSANGAEWHHTRV
jgi:hypothetical protein